MVGEVRDRYRERGLIAPPVDAMVVYAVVPLLGEFPQMNARVDGDEAVYYGRYDVAVATDTPAGLMVPVVRDADRLTLDDLTSTIGSLMADARARRLMPDAMAGATFTVSNIGGFGGGFGNSILPPDTTALLSIGRAPTGMRPEPAFMLSLTVDHRLVDGGPAARFISAVADQLEGGRLASVLGAK
jgi:pyruvate/2-oxoglutarate dehydrogenase complex dihydrolipoamide acyltransferase (E2) component